MNDIQEFIQSGIRPENIWAIESDKDTYVTAIEQLKVARARVKIHKGSLKTFLEQSVERFDIVYYDACGPLPGGHPNTVLPLLPLFMQGRLADLCSLITNFSEPGEEKHSAYVSLLADFFATRYDDLPRPLRESSVDPADAQHQPELFHSLVSEHIQEVYSDFATRFIVDLSRYILPCWRVAALPENSRIFFSDEENRKKVVKGALRIPEVKVGEPGWMEKLLFSIGDMLIAPNGYPLGSFLRRSADNVILKDFLTLKVPPFTLPLKDAFQLTDLLANVYEGHWQIANPILQRLVMSGWFDWSPKERDRAQYFCDLPLPNLMVNLLLGTYGHPYYYNCRTSSRLTYIAKTNRMYSDVLVLDKCRYLHDYVPTLDLMESAMKSRAFQLVIRVCMDRIHWHDFDARSNPFSGSAIADMGETSCAEIYGLPGRLNLSP